MIFGSKKALIAGLVIAASGFGPVGHVQAATPKLSFEAAVDVCTQRAIRFGRTVYGRYADEPPPHVVQDRYRSCVYAYSHQYPKAKVQYRDTVLRLQSILE